MHLLQSFYYFLSSKILSQGCIQYLSNSWLHCIYYRCGVCWSIGPKNIWEINHCDLFQCTVIILPKSASSHNPLIVFRWIWLDAFAWKKLVLQSPLVSHKFVDQQMVKINLKLYEKFIGKTRLWRIMWWSRFLSSVWCTW